MNKTKEDVSGKELLAINIKELCNLDSRSNEDLADRMGVSSSQLSRYKYGKNEPKATSLIAIAKVLDVDVRRLFMTNVEWEAFIESLDSRK